MLSCPDHATSAEQSTSEEACECNAGYFLQNDACTQCLRGTFKDVTGNEACTSCPAGFAAKDLGMTACTDCSLTGQYSIGVRCSPCFDSDKEAPPGSNKNTDCRCKRGYHENGDNCALCEAGKFSNQLGQGSCDSCSGNTISAAGATVCSDCGPGQVANSEKTACSGCNPGHILQGTECKPCEAGKKAVANSCESCADGTFSTEAQTVCTDCIAGTFSNQNTGKAACQLCATGKYSSAPQSTTCLDCDAGKRCRGTPVCSV